MARPPASQQSDRLQADRLQALGRAVPGAGRGLPPVELWNPPDCGDIGLRIDRNGAWFYRDSRIDRPALARLFSTILRRDPDGYVLVTPVEKVRVEVEDAPFVAVELRQEQSADGPVLRLRTNMDDWTTAGADRPLRFEKDAHDGLKPYVRVRGELWARLARPLLFELVELGEVREIQGSRVFGVASGAEFFFMAAAGEIEDLA
jgi:uncharacterized protein